MKTREELVAIMRSMDRIAPGRHYCVSQLVPADHRVAHWDIFGWPEKKPDYAFTPEMTWWFDRDKASAIGMAG